MPRRSRQAAALVLACAMLFGTASADASGHRLLKRILTTAAIAGVSYEISKHAGRSGRSIAQAGESAGGAGGDERPYPDRSKTPGAVLAVTEADVCVPGYTKQVRNVPLSLKREVYASYGVAYVSGADEVDHFVPLTLGGSNDIKNLWPEPYNQTWGAHQKDELESALHRAVCFAKSLSLRQAQSLIAADWIAAYRQYVSPTPRPNRINYGN